ncbi:ArnT family glycosyltransferase [Algisphaera agarilytica]|uniref:4-amino-4-deoxy-L-arabinose transferase-like glycosyltransferase n=1 Tax=Algisphaera agarilytica TaxID=1385975 RepID=A0A7X0LL48_9BACT|nr:glycosyltransferase family 39 protein [Algisphaera agarilytica]MBB6430514.1 4-amino-4-deoxy-L-arabinose transferase-like glycosyltransferase [Algisphaera agarilytica]
MRWGVVLAWGVLTAAALWPGLADAPLTGTEGHRAMTGSQMLERGEYVVPTLFGQTYLRKPPGQYWLIAGAEGVVGQPTEWVWRLPGVLSIAGLVALLAWWGGRWFGTMGALAAGAAAVSLFSWWTMARSADIDAANTLAVGLCVVGLMEAGV